MPPQDHRKHRHFVKRRVGLERPRRWRTRTRPMRLFSSAGLEARQKKVTGLLLPTPGVNVVLAVGRSSNMLASPEGPQAVLADWLKWLVNVTVTCCTGAGLLRAHRLHLLQKVLDPLPCDCGGRGEVHCTTGRGDTSSVR